MVVLFKDFFRRIRNKGLINKNQILTSCEIEEDLYGINKANAHSNAIELIPEDFFWSGDDELAPFGSDEGDMALSEFRDWRKDNPNSPTYDCLKLTVESIFGKNIMEYDENILDKNLIKNQINEDTFMAHQNIYKVDISIIATGFAQLVDEGKIDTRNKPLLQLAINRQKICTELDETIKNREIYRKNLEVLERVL